jgi:pimeloyl-ACP methyl ester carboxylesterase
VSVAASMAARGIAVLTINAVANGGGPLGTIRITASGMTPVVIPAGGRTTDPNNTGTFDAIRESSALPPYSLLSYSDSMRQTVVDLMQLVRVIETGGMDYDGDGSSDLDAARIYYFGHSWGAMYGSVLLGVEPNIRAGVLSNGGGGIGIVSGLSPISRQFAGSALAARVPSLSNVTPMTAPLWGFDANTPLRNQPVVINTVPGAAAIQEYSERGEWAQQGGAPVAFASYIRKDPLAGANPKPVIVQFGKGDQNVPNPTQTNLVRAGDLADVTTFYRTDLAVAVTPTVPKNPHNVLTSAFTGAQPIVRSYGRALQNQIAEFFASDGATINDPDGTNLIFETPIVPPLPEELNFIP